jgi:hypothetical protein
MKSSKYLLTPPNMNVVRAGRTAHVCRRGHWVVQFLGNKFLDWKLMLMDWSFVNIARDVTIMSSEMYLVLGISLSCSLTRS